MRNAKLWILVSLSIGVFSHLQAEETTAPPAVYAYAAKDYSYLLDMPGWSKSLLLMHFKLYQGYVNNTNLLMQQIQGLSKEGQTRSYEFGALKRRLDWEFDGMRLHELYFGNLGGKGAIRLDDSLSKQLEKNFGSVETWKQDFISTGLIRGIGWAILYRDRNSGNLFNVWINEHDVGHFVEADPLLVMDVFEHAYITQFGLEKEKYIELFFQSVNWPVVNQRWASAMGEKK
jgi:superoxide dismutase, Fe-Mn family